MKTKLLILFFAFSISLYAGVKKYGKKISLKEKTKISTIIENPEKYDGKRILIEGKIVDVCETRGCWIKIAGEKDFQSIKFKVEDGVIIFPLDSKGKKILAEGVFSVTKLTKEELIESAKEIAKENNEQFDSTKITSGKTVIKILGEGAEIK